MGGETKKSQDIGPEISKTYPPAATISGLVVNALTLEPIEGPALSPTVKATTNDKAGSSKYPSRLQQQPAG